MVGRPDATAGTHINDGRVRAQDVCSPVELLEHNYRILGAPFDLDPCSNAKSKVRARRKIRLRPGQDPRGGGLAARWRGTVYANIPFGWVEHGGEEVHTFGLWLRKAWTSSREAETIMLCPIRTHRSYWRAAWTAQAWAMLPPVVFDGHQHGFTMPMCQLYWGPRPHVFCRVMRQMRDAHAMLLCSRVTSLALLEQEEKRCELHQHPKRPSRKALLTTPPPAHPATA